MTDSRRNPGLTLVEMLLAVAIVAILVTLMAVSTGSLRKAAQVRLTESTLAVISSALQQYNDFWGTYPPQIDPAADLTVATEVQKALAAAVGWSPATDVTVPAGHNWRLTYDEALYLRLSRTPVSRKIISGFVPVSETEAGKRSARVAVIYTPRAAVAPATGQIPTFVEWGAGTADKKPNQVSLYRFVDFWRTELKYEYKAGDPYPIVTSAGPDGNFGTPDDIKSTGK